jgi:hypothetical protein
MYNYLFLLIFYSASAAAQIDAQTDAKIDAHIDEIHLRYTGDPQDSAYLGVMQGLEEANVQGQFLGQHYQIDTSAAGATPDPKSPALATLAALDGAALRQLSASAPDTLILNLTAPDDDLRQNCLANVLHIPPSAQMQKDGFAQWQAEHPGGKAEIAAWHPAFEKYSATQLNLRYQKKHKRNMDDRAWAGWAAVKLIADSVARAKPKNSADLAAFLRTKLAFDGQKGVEMSFRPNGQLRQPLLVVQEGKVVGEVPVKGKDLDSLGTRLCTAPVPAKTK